MVATATGPGNLAARSCGRSVIEDRDGARPAAGRGTDFDRKATHRETLRGQRFKVVQLLDMAVADLAADAMALPDQARVLGRGVFLLGVDERRVPAPAVDTGDTDAALEKIERRLATHAAAGRDVIGAAIGFASRGVHQHDLER